MLQLSFQTRDVRAICEEDTRAQQRLGAAAADALRHRLEDLHAASTVFDVLVGNLRLEAAAIDGSVYLLDLEDGWVLRFRANHAKLPLTGDGVVDWVRVSRIQIMDISRMNSTAEDGSDA
jgi:toxin HigB-1